MHGLERKLTRKALELLEYFPSVAILGPRQCGKTTMAFDICDSWPTATTYLDLENAGDLAKLEDSVSFLTPLEEQLVVIDEVQHRPGLFPEIRGLIDDGRRRNLNNGRFLFLGLGSYELLQQSGESLAGRIAYLELTPFRTNETDDPDTLWARGGFPDSFLAPSESFSREWRRNFIDTYLTRDLGMLDRIGSLPAMRSLMQMTAHLHGQVLNVTQLVESHEFSRKQINRFLDLFEQTYVIRRLQPYLKNVGKRLTKRPKIYVRDTGLLHQLLNIASFEDLHGHPMRGASFEGFVIEQITALLPDWTPYFYRTSHGAEIDLVMTDGNNLYAFEIKASSSPTLTRGFHLARADIEPTRTFVISRSDATWTTSKGIVYARVDDLPDLLG